MCVNARHVWDLLEFVADPSRDAVRSHLTNIALLQRRAAGSSSPAGGSSSAAGRSSAGGSSSPAGGCRGAAEGRADGGLSDVEDWAHAEWEAGATATAAASGGSSNVGSGSDGGHKVHGGRRRGVGSSGGTVTGSGELLSPLFCHWLLLRRWGARGLAHVRWGPGDTLSHVQAVRRNPAYELSRSVSAPAWMAVARAAAEARLDAAPLPPPPPPPPSSGGAPRAGAEDGGDAGSAGGGGSGLWR